MKSILINSLFLLVATTCFGQNRMKKSVPYGVYSKEGYSFIFPRNWSLDDSKKDIFLSTELDALDDLFRENIIFKVQPFGSEKITVEEYLEALTVEMKKASARNLNVSIFYDSLTKSDIGEIDFSMDYNGKESLFKQVIKIHDNTAYVFTYTGRQIGFDKYLPIANKVMRSLSFNRNLDGYNSAVPLKYENLLHKLYFTHLEGYEDMSEDNKNYLFRMANLSDNKLRNYSLKYSDDWSFRVAGNANYTQSITQETIKSILETVYSDVSINVFEKSFPKTLRENVFHVVFSGVEIETGERMTIATFQMVKNHKMYTLSCGCKSSYFSGYYDDCLKLLKSLTIF